MERLTMRNDEGIAFWADPKCCGGGYRMAEDVKDQERLDRLAAYEDALPLERAQELSQAGKDGRLVVLPPVSESASAFQKNLDVFELFLAIKWAHAAALMDEKPD